MKTLLTDKYDLMQDCLDRLSRIFFAGRPLGDAETTAKAIEIITEYEIARDNMLARYELMRNGQRSHQAAVDLGMVKVTGANGGTYYE